MLTIRMQRTGRKGHAMFRMVVQDSRVAPTSGKVVAMLGSFDPHTKTATLKKDQAAAFLKNGAQPSDRAALLLKKEGVKLPNWVSVDTKKKGTAKHPEKLRKNQPKDATPAPQAQEVTEAVEAPAVTEEPAPTDAPAESTAEAPAPTEEVKE